MKVSMLYKCLLFIKQLVIKAIIISIFLLLLSFMPSFSVASENDAYEHLSEAMDKFNNSFDVYTNQDEGGNHFYPSGWMGYISSISIDTNWITNCYSGTSCIKINFTASGSNWAGIYWQEPENNWGTVPNGGYDISGATKVTFWARGETGGEKVEFFAGGITGPYPDSLAKTSTGYITLASSWQEYTINLTSKDLSHVIGGFGWVTNSAKNTSGATFYLDDIRYDKSRPDEPRFLVSFETLPLINPDRYIKNAGLIYDNALALLAFLARGNDEYLRRTKILADAFVYAQNNDRYYTDGRLRDAYMSGDLIDHLTGKVKIPGWWDPIDKKWHEDEFQVSTYTGDMTWVMIALLSYYKKVGGAQYLEAAITLGEWIETKTKDTRGAGGYNGGYKGWEPNPQKITWKSTEHNIDIYVAFMLLYEITSDMKWKERSLHAKSFIEAMWDGDKNHFWTGTLDDGVTINYGNIPADIQAGAIMTINSYPSALSWVEDNCYTEHDGFKGFDFNTDKDGVWFEGTAQMVIAYQINGETNKSDTYLAELQKAQAFATNTNGKGIVAACHDGITTGFDWEYFNRLQIGATAWYIFAEKGYNPYWGSDTTPPLAPINLTSTPDNWTNINSFSINWTDPDDLSGIAGAYYKLGFAPTSNTDGAYTTSKPFTVSATAEGGQDIYVWLKDRAGNNSYLNRSSTILYYDGAPPTDGNLTATPGDGQISLSWSGFSDSGGSGLKSTDTYKVVRATSNYPDSQCANGTQVYLGTDSSTIDSGLTKGTTYYYQVCAYDNAGNVSTGAKSNATPQAANTTPSTGSGSKGCFIATAAYGSYLDPHVKVLRDFRYNYLLTNPIGRAFIKIYYIVSPPIAEFISEYETLKVVTRWCLTPIVYSVKYPTGALLSIVGLIAISIVWKIKRYRNLMIKLRSLNKI